MMPWTVPHHPPHREVGRDGGAPWKRSSRWAWSTTLNANANANAETGAIVVGLDGRSAAYRSAVFRTAFDGADDELGAADHFADLRNPVVVRPYIDIDRVGRPR